MTLFIIIGVTIFILDRVVKVKRSNNVIIISSIFILLFLVHLVFNSDSILIQLAGGSSKNLIFIGILYSTLALYAVLLNKIKSYQSISGLEKRTGSSFKSEELDRYARHIILKEIGGSGQKKLKNARVLVIGAGGLGSPVLQYLGACGVGVIGIIDNDLVDNSNLHRQVIYPDSAIGENKVFAAAEVIKSQNPFVEVLTFNRFFNVAIAKELISDFDVVVDGTDNTSSRYLINEMCVLLKKPLVSGAIAQWEGQVMVYDSMPESPCYQCVFPLTHMESMDVSCSTLGVVGALPGVIGSIMAVETIKLIINVGELLSSRLLIYDGLFAETRTISTKKNSKCPICFNEKFRYK